jgi:hypothetical protein
MTYSKDPVVYIGYDAKEHVAFEVLVESIKRTASRPIHIVPIKADKVRAAGLYNRCYRVDENGQYWDISDGRPFSTAFSFSRFLVPALEQYEGWGLFMDCDMMVRSDIWEIFETFNDPDYAVYTVPHSYIPPEGLKLDGKLQQPYPFKNWSSFMLFNCSHPVNLDLSPDNVSRKSGRWMHSFQWLPSNDLIGRIPEEWNWLDDHSDPTITPKNVHFTTGGPWFEHWKPARECDETYAEEWLKRKKEYGLSND